jgi:hypothetical protein
MMTRVRFSLVIATACALSSACAGRINDGVWQPFAERSYATAIGTAIHESSWLFAIVESFHLVGLALLGGAILIVDLRLIGLGLRDESVAELAQGARPWLLGGLTAMLVSGLLLYLSEATKFYSEGFWDSAEFPFIYKMLFLVLALIFTFGVRQRLLTSEFAHAHPMLARLVGATSLLLWLGVAVGGRGIGFY